MRGLLLLALACALLLAGCAGRKPAKALAADAPILPDNCVRNVRCPAHYRLLTGKDGKHRLVCPVPEVADLECISAK